MHKTLQGSSLSGPVTDHWLTTQETADYWYGLDNQIMTWQCRTLLTSMPVGAKWSHCILQNAAWAYTSHWPGIVQSSARQTTRCHYYTVYTVFHWPSLYTMSRCPHSKLLVCGISDHKDNGNNEQTITVDHTHYHSLCLRLIMKTVVVKKIIQDKAKLDIISLKGPWSS